MPTDLKISDSDYDRDLAMLLAGYFRGFATTDRYALTEFDRKMMRDASSLMCRIVGRPDMDFEESESERAKIHGA